MSENIARYLNLPDYIVDMYDELCCDMINYDEYVNIYELDDDYLIITKNVSYIIDKINEIIDVTPKYIMKKFIIIVFLYYYFDKCFTTIKNNNKNNKRCLQAIYEKLEDIKNVYKTENIQFYDIFYNYINETFETEKRFLIIKHNKIYRKKILKNYMLSLVRFNKLYQDTLEKRYAPNGLGYFEAEKHFTEIIKLT
jgi:hypothetical protein